jgi:hypothetical protein
MVSSSGGSAPNVSLCIDTTDDPAIEICSAHLAPAVLLGLVTVQDTARQLLWAFVNPGYNLQLRRTGAGTATVVAQIEVQL